MVTGLSVLRCPACGQQLESSADRCPLCEIQLGDDPITGDDLTPYARAHAQGRRGWSGMVAWVWSAGVAESHPHDVVITKESPNYALEYLNE